MNPMPEDNGEASDNLSPRQRSADSGRVLDRGAMLGLVVTGALVVWLMVAGTGLSAGVFFRLPALALVIGGAVLTTVVAYPSWRPGALRTVLSRALWSRARSPEETIATLTALAQIARRDGLLALERPVSRLDNAFFRRAMQMAIDGYTPSTIEAVMQTEIESTDLRHTMGKGLLTTMGRSAPVFGMIGTLIGLVAMLGEMHDPAMIGPGMAVALLTTLYGLLLANVVCLPLARRLGHRSSEELLDKTIALKGALAIQAGDHPRIVARKLEAYLPPDRRESLADRLWSDRPTAPAFGSGRREQPVDRVDVQEDDGALVDAA